MITTLVDLNKDNKIHNLRKRFHYYDLTIVMKYSYDEIVLITSIEVPKANIKLKRELLVNLLYDE